MARKVEEEKSRYLFVMEKSKILLFLELGSKLKTNYFNFPNYF